MKKIRLLVGLGNPGITYQQTRHNIGFLVMNALAKKHSVSFSIQKKLKGALAEISTEQEQIILLKPNTFMNKSGEAVLATKNFYRIEKESIAIIYDDADLDFGELRIRKTGSSGGHRGMKSIIELLGTQDIARLRIGIGRPQHPDFPLDEWVLQKWTKREQEKLPEIIEQAITKIAL